MTNLVLGLHVYDDFGWEQKACQWLSLFRPRVQRGFVHLGKIPRHFDWMQECPSKACGMQLNGSMPCAIAPIAGIRERLGEGCAVGVSVAV